MYTYAFIVLRSQLGDSVPKKYGEFLFKKYTRSDYYCKRLEENCTSDKNELRDRGEATEKTSDV